MFSPAPPTAALHSPTIHCSPADALALTQRRLDELDRLRGVGMEQAEKLNLVTRNLTGAPDAQYRALVGTKGTIREFDRLNRAIRQIVVLEFEIRGLFKAPDRDGGIKKPKLGESRYDLMRDLHDYGDLFDDRRDLDDINDLNDLRVRLDYSRDPMERLVADIRDMLGVLPPENDPFAPQADRKSPEPKPMSHDAAVMERAAEKLRRLIAQKKRPGMVAGPVAQAAAKQAKAKPMPRKGFRIPPTSPHNPNTAPAAKRRRNRGPPGKRR